MALTYNQIRALLDSEPEIAGRCGTAEHHRPGYSGAALVQPAPAGEKKKILFRCVLTQRDNADIFCGAGIEEREKQAHTVWG